MRFVLFTPLTVSQCMSALHDRLHSKAAGRPTLEGWVEKNGRFALRHSSRVGGRFRRDTRLEGLAAKEDGLTVIRGHVPDGLPRDTLLWLAAGFVVACGLLLAQGNVMTGVALLGLGGIMAIPLVGDHNNHAVLLAELEKTLKAKPTPPNVRAGTSAADGRARRPVARAKPTSTKKLASPGTRREPARTSAKPATRAAAKPKAAAAKATTAAKPRAAAPKAPAPAKTTGTTPRVPTPPRASTPSGVGGGSAQPR